MTGGVMTAGEDATPSVCRTRCQGGAGEPVALFPSRPAAMTIPTYSPAPGGGEEPTPKGHAMKVVIEDGELVIRVPLDRLASATTLSPGLDDVAYDDEGKERPITITDPVAWANAVRRELVREGEDGTTLVHRMFDRAFHEALESGAEGIHIPGVTD